MEIYSIVNKDENFRKIHCTCKLYILSEVSQAQKVK